MLEIEIDGKKVEVPEGSSVIQAAHQAGTYIPHFCYHKKLSIAASCRMCLVEVEKAPKPLPACATPVTNGMKVTTHSDKAVAAQKSVMEFLLINHPLDCPICDQGGECQLQDLAVGYGGSSSRYQEEKRVVFNKNLGPLISTDMTRCIHCTRCVRFGQEIAGVMELGMAGRGEHSEIMSFVGRTVNSELSGNMIDLCPVGALTSKPFRFGARTWEMSRRRSVSPHDSLGSNLVVQVKHDEVKRVLPLENEEINECWLSDKDRFSYEGLQAKDRLTKPKIKHGGQWHDVDWQTALEYVAKALNGVSAQHGAQAIGALLSPHSTVEELYLSQKLLRALGSENIDFRLRQSDFSLDHLDQYRKSIPWLGLPVAELSKQDAVLVIGSFLRKDHPLLALRLRQAAKQGCKLSRIHASKDDWFVPLHSDVIVAPSEFVHLMAQVLKALEMKTGTQSDVLCQEIVDSVTVEADAQRIAEALLSGQKKTILLGNFAVQHPDYASLHTLAQEIARLCNGQLGITGEAANSVGGYVVNALPSAQGKNALQMLQDPLKAYILLGAEPLLDCADGALAKKALMQAETVIHLGCFEGDAPDYADVMLPIAPFTETSGTYINTEGRAQSFNAVVRSPDNVRPGWKVLRVLGSMMGFNGFEFETSEAVLQEALSGDWSARLDNRVSGAKPNFSRLEKGALQRIADVPIYAADALVRRAASLQKTEDARILVARISAMTLSQAGIVADSKVCVKSDNGDALILDVVLDDSIPPGCIKIPTSSPMTMVLGPMFGNLTMEKV